MHRDTLDCSPASAAALKRQVLAKFPDVEISGEGTPGVTGWFEVQVVGGAVLHSKKGGDGYVDSEAKLNKILDGIAAAKSA
jgi:selT/selW/selH-like putative selenoprotein